MTICGDYRLTVNQAAHRESYPLPTIEDILSQLSRLPNAYQQVALDDHSKQYVAINTYLGCFNTTVSRLGSICTCHSSTDTQGAPSELGSNIDPIVSGGVAVESSKCPFSNQRFSI